MQNSKRSLMLLPFAWRQWTCCCCSSFLFGVCSVFCSVLGVQCPSNHYHQPVKIAPWLLLCRKKIVLLFSSLGFPRVAQCSCPALPCLAVWLHPNSAPGSVKCKCLHRKLACIELISSSCVKWKELRGLSPSRCWPVSAAANGFLIYWKKNGLWVCDCYVITSSNGSNGNRTTEYLLTSWNIIAAH